MPAVILPNANAGRSDEGISLPLFDVSHETPELGKAVVQAAAKWGFLWVAGSPPIGASSNAADYDLNEEIVDKVFDASRSFFKNSTISEKERCSIKHNRGFVGMHVENLDPSKHKRGDFKQAFNLAEPDHTTHEWQQPMPSLLSDQDALLRDFQTRCRRLAFRILRLIAIGLEIEDVDWLVRCHEQATQSTRLLYYPTLPPGTDYDPQADIRAGAHSDYGSITLLFTRPDQPGLEILTPDGRSWASVPIFPDNYHSKTFPPIVVNIGDLLDYWTNGLLKSTVHRVILSASSTIKHEDSDNDHADRFSIAVFVQPADDTKLTAIPSAAVQAKAASFRDRFADHHGVRDAQSEMTAGEHLKSRLRATYGDVFSEEPKKAIASVS